MPNMQTKYTPKNCLQWTQAHPFFKIAVCGYTYSNGLIANLSESYGGGGGGGSMIVGCWLSQDY